MLAFIRSQTFTPRDFVIDTNGVCRLHPELARQVAGLDLGTEAAALRVAIATRLVRELPPSSGGG